MVTLVALLVIVGAGQRLPRLAVPEEHRLVAVALVHQHVSGPRHLQQPPFVNISETGLYARVAIVTMEYETLETVEN